MTFYIPVWLFWIVCVPVMIGLLVLAYFGYQFIRFLLEMLKGWH